MYSKNKCNKIIYQVIIDNKVSVEFNTNKKRETFLKRVGNTRNVTCISNFAYPWNVEDGFHNLISPEDFASNFGYSISRVKRAIQNGKFKCEPVGDNPYIVEKNDYYEIGGGCYRLDAVDTSKNAHEEIQKENKSQDMTIE
jgi:hypothetical protein